jgi:hypothetical protein
LAVVTGPEGWEEEEEEEDGVKVARRLTAVQHLQLLLQSSYF